MKISWFHYIIKLADEELANYDGAIVFTEKIQKIFEKLITFWSEFIKIDIDN